MNLPHTVNVTGDVNQPDAAGVIDNDVLLGLDPEMQRALNIAVNEYDAAEASDVGVPVLKRAEDVLRMAERLGCTDDQGLVLLPQFCRKLGIELKSESLEQPVSGRLQCRDGVWEISVNKAQIKERQRFTVAHELGHYFLHVDRSDDGNEIGYTDTSFFRSNSYSAVENAANNFAGELLMPERLVNKLFEDEKMRDVGAMAKYFRVSRLAMEQRLRRLGYEVQ